EEKVTHNGRHWQFTDATVRPGPLQKPRPPILIGAQVEQAIARAARIADGWLVVPTPKAEEVHAQMALYHSERGRARLPPSPHVRRLLEVSCARDEETAYKRAAPYLLEKYASYASWGLGGVSANTSAPPEEQLRRLATNRFAVGTPARVIET